MQDHHVRMLYSIQRWKTKRPKIALKLLISRVWSCRLLIDKTPHIRGCSIQMGGYSESRACKYWRAFLTMLPASATFLMTLTLYFSAPKPPVGSFGMCFIELIILHNQRPCPLHVYNMPTLTPCQPGYVSARFVFLPWNFSPKAPKIWCFQASSRGNRWRFHRSWCSWPLQRHCTWRSTGPAGRTWSTPRDRVDDHPRPIPE